VRDDEGAPGNQVDYLSAVVGAVAAALAASYEACLCSLAGFAPVTIFEHPDAPPTSSGSSRPSGSVICLVGVMLAEQDGERTGSWRYMGPEGLAAYTKATMSHEAEVTSDT
jgi:hypothetical protein